MDKDLNLFFGGNVEILIKFKPSLYKSFTKKVGVVFCIVKHLYKKSYLRLTLRKKGSKFSGLLSKA